MNDTNTIDVQATPAPTQAVAIREQAGAVGRAMTIDELRANLDYIRQVMQSVMKEGQDYGKIPGCGEKPCLMQPGAQKLLMTFQLTDHVKKEVLREYPNWHREYEFTVCVRAQNGKEWDGVGTCSTLESKYRYRKAERRCPKCGTNNIIAGKAEYGGGWLCWKKKGGCGEKFPEDDQRITSQPAGDVENDDPADTWNTVRKMAFKRALVAAAINATNTSELWTQDLDERAPEAPQDAPGRAASPPPPSTATAPPKAAASPKREAARPANAPTPAANFPPATAETRTRMIAALVAGEGQANRAITTEYFRKIENCLLPNEHIEDLPLRFVPISKAQMAALVKAIADFEAGGEAKAAFPPNPEAPPAKAKAAAPAKPVEVPRDPPASDEAWRTFPMPWGKHAGVKLEDLEKNYLFGLWANYEVEREFKGKPKKAETIAKDETFRAMLDLAGKHYEFRKSEDDDQDDSDERRAMMDGNPTDYGDRG